MLYGCGTVTSVRPVAAPYLLLPCQMKQEQDNAERIYSI